ncbi:DUF7619 domain-containing protein [Flavobacterium aurantiibacter]|uniref:Uncharacterized protein n=1 Tax=Flavobacterium aurantiibacter TaxID=2023067 RepID=A0A255ZPV0_9FLAO|nr:T9SS type A sorting domain-containing protein [Flavobacterium aurantiibacter]OYQ43486.1 hypothetical protein CHX27_10055 [Flavobacterium aurantiibacter]
MRFLCTLLLLLAFQVSVGQIIEFANDNFKQRLILASSTNGIARDFLGNSIKVDVNNNYEIEVSECLAVFQLDVYGQFIESLSGIEHFANLKRLECGNNLLSHISLDLLTNLEELRCSFNQLTSLNLVGGSSLQHLVCEHNNLTTLDLASSSDLRTLSCGNNFLTSLDISSNSELRILECENNSLSTLNATFSDKLSDLDCKNNLLTSLFISNDFTSGGSIGCQYNQLTTIQVEGRFTSINCSYNYLTSLDLSNSKIGSTTCTNNLLTNYICAQNIDDLNWPHSANLMNNNISNFIVSSPILLSLYLAGNPLTQFTNYPDGGIAYLTIDSSVLTELDLSTMSGVIELYVTAPLTSLILPENHPLSVHLSQVNLNEFTHKKTSNAAFGASFRLIDGNITNLNLIGKFKDIRIKNTNIQELDFSNITHAGNVVSDVNYSITDNTFLEAINFKNNFLDLPNQGTPQYGTTDFVLSNNPNLTYICLDTNELAFTLQNTPNINNYSVNTYCSYSPGAFYDITTFTTLDSNLNGCEDSDTGFPWVEFQISTANNSGTIFSNNIGNFSIPVQAGNYTLTPNLPHPDYFSITPPTATVTFPGTDFTVHTDFCVTPVGEHHDLEVTLIPTNVAIPGFDANYKIVLKNNGNQIESGTLALTYPDSLIDLISTNPSSNSETTNVINWEFSNLAPLASRSYDIIFNLNSPLDTPPVILNDVLYFNASANLEQDETPENNTAILNQTVVDAFDPNDKTCLEGEIINPAMIGKYIHYKIRFENLGTYFAQNVIVEDFIDTTKFDLSTLEPITASHNFFTRVTGNKVEFVFNNIMLPFDDANNDGYVVFKIKTKADLVLGDTVSNTAGIYFNYNPPVITNTASSTFTTLNVSNPQELEVISLYPNPTSNTLYLKADSLQIDTVSIFNMLGQEVLKVSGNNLREINTSALTAGSYILSAKAASQTVNLKFVKQ